MFPMLRQSDRMGIPVIMCLPRTVNRYATYNVTEPTLNVATVFTMVLFKPRRCVKRATGLKAILSAGSLAGPGQGKSNLQGDQQPNAPSRQVPRS